jgi:hypothetical protein
MMPSSPTDPTDLPLKTDEGLCAYCSGPRRPAVTPARVAGLVLLVLLALLGLLFLVLEGGAYFL